jgi:hypothetical protein
LSYSARGGGSYGNNRRNRRISNSRRGNGAPLGKPEKTAGNLESELHNTNGLTEEDMTASIKAIRNRLESGEIDKADAINDLADLVSIYGEKDFAWALTSLMGSLNSEDEMDTADIINYIDDFF